MNLNFGISKGWECPKCGRVYSPTWPKCNHCPSPSTTTSSSTTFTQNLPERGMIESHVFIEDDTSSSATKCKLCGMEKFYHRFLKPEINEK